MPQIQPEWVSRSAHGPAVPQRFMHKLALLCALLASFAGQAPSLAQTPPTNNVQYEVINKPSYGRGVGTVPTNCGPGREYDAGLCYPPCATGFRGVGPVCWQTCPPGYSDDGATCRHDASIISSDNGACPWYDKCGLTFARGCSKCPPGYANDGCTCRIDANIFGKSTYTRGVGSLPTACPGGREYDAGLCYTPCNPGFTGVGPVCWGTCPTGYEDWGVQCAKRIL
jgi:hypothetical protein